MANLNKALFIGRLTRDPELRYTQGGQAVCSFGLAVNREYKTQDGQKNTETFFIDVETWGSRAETLHKYLNKGSQVYIEGRLKSDSWEKDGQVRYKTKLVTENFQFLDSAKSGSDEKVEQPEEDYSEEPHIPF
ncbi:MAG: single-stranded DNA-binding protein [Bdellovibrionales bacterium]|nr:single-stranded DNA-binding protein [Bdellovibrionales bacterium]